MNVPASDLPARCRMAVRWLANRMASMPSEDRYSEMLVLTTAEDPDFYSGPSSEELSGMDADALYAALIDHAYPFDGDLPLALCHAVEKGAEEAEIVDAYCFLSSP